MIAAARYAALICMHINMSLLYMQPIRSDNICLDAVTVVQYRNKFILTHICRTFQSIKKIDIIFDRLYIHISLNY